MACSLLLLDSAIVEIDMESDYNVPLIHLETLKVFINTKFNQTLTSQRVQQDLDRGFSGLFNKSSDVTVW